MYRGERELRIVEIRAREILDSRGFPTIESDVVLECGIIGRAAVPSGASTGVHEALELRDDEKTRYMGKGVRKAIENVKIMASAVILPKKIPATEQREIDRLMIEYDGTPNKSKVGANAILSVSMAAARAAAYALGVPLYRYLGGGNSFLLPTPFMNILNGGKHGDNPLEFQEFMIVPAGAPNFSEAIRYGSEVFHSLKSILKSKGLGIAVGDEGGFSPKVSNTRETLSVIVSAIEKAGLKPGKDVFLALDPAASEFFNSERQVYEMKTEGRDMSPAEMVDFYAKLVDEFPLVSIEDGMAEDDWEGWKIMTDRLGSRIQLIGDDLFVTNIERLREGIKRGVTNSILIKLNQIGSVSETIDTINLARRVGYTAVVSHRSGETEDPFISDFTVAMGCGMIKTGSLSRSERLAKYNQLIRIEEELGNQAVFAGTGIIKNFNR
ncbi:MAG: phosphopyruvate hydratase [Deltaproteobacteria bacterium]|nr:phosphopyruvate hydratase [Deltaproteobacteria bacterium]